MTVPFLIIRAWKIHKRLIEWTVCLNKIMKFFFFIKVLVIILFMKKNFSAENIFIFQLFLPSTLLFYKHSVFLGVRLSMLMIFLSWALHFAYKICSIQKVRTLWWRGQGVLQKEEEILSRVDVRLYFFKVVVSHLNSLFLFLTSLMGNWKL